MTTTKSEKPTIKRRTTCRHLGLSTHASCQRCLAENDPGNQIFKSKSPKK